MQVYCLRSPSGSVILVILILEIFCPHLGAANDSTGNTNGTILGRVDDDCSSEDALFVRLANLEVLELPICEPGFLLHIYSCFILSSILCEQCISGAQGEHGTSITVLNVDVAEVADVASEVAFVKFVFFEAVWIEVATSAGAGITKVTDLMDVEAMFTWG